MIVIDNRLLFLWQLDPVSVTYCLLSVFLCREAAPADGWNRTIQERPRCRTCGKSTPEAAVGWATGNNRQIDENWQHLCRWLITGSEEEKSYSLWFITGKLLLVQFCRLITYGLLNYQTTICKSIQCNRLKYSSGKDRSEMCYHLVLGPLSEERTKLRNCFLLASIPATHYVHISW